MVISKIEGQQDKAKEQQYPWLGRFKDTDIVGEIFDFIVLFSEKTKGTVVWSASSQRPVGMYSESWIDSCFEKFEGEISLKNG